MKKHLLTTLFSVFLSMFAFAQTQVDLPITFDDVNTNYNLVDFGGNISAIVADPVNAANNVCQVEKTNTAQLWAGTTLGASLANPIPFAANANKISVRVYSPDAGIIVKLKAEDPNDATKSVEANLITTTSNAWETLEFDFTNQAPGTAAINYGYNYQMLSIFFNFGIDGATAGAKTYYCDDVTFMPATVPTIASITFQVQSPDSTPVWVFGSWSGWSNWPGDAMTPIGNNTWEITLNLPANTNQEYLFVNGTTPTKEILNPADACTNGNAQYTNRTLAVGTTAATYCSIWATCNSCNTTPTSAAITFQVQSPDSTPVWVFGSWSGWSNYPGDAMTPIGNNTWEITLNLPANTNQEYLFVNGTIPTKEILNPADACTNGNAQYTNRTLAIGTTAATYCSIWATCNSCNTTLTTAAITFQVQNPDSTPVWVFGSWSGWSNYPGDAMTPIGNNTWEITLNLPANTNQEYLFVNGTTPIKEALNPADACTNGNAQYTNRTLAIGTTAATYCSIWATCNSCNTTPTTAAITFQVQSPDSTPVWVFGSWSGWSNYPGDAMTPIGNNTWEITLNLPVNSNFEYLYVNGTTPIKEALNPADPCTNGNAQYTNRTLAVGTTPATYCAQWATCNPCSSGPAQVNVTFQVQNPDSIPVFVFGSWSGWSNYPGDVMTPIGNGVYSVTLPLNANSNYEYLFVNGGTPIKEVLDPAWPCTNGNSQYTNRTLAVAAADLTVCAQWATCNSCTSVPALANVTFQVENPDSVPVYVFGSWNGWSNYPGTPMTSIGNGIYEATIQLGTNANYEYLFVNGTTPAKEVLNPAWPCTNGNGQYTNRTLAFGASDTTVCSIWATCSACGTVAPVYINATFQVQSPDSTPVYVFGSWSGWANWPGTAMTSIGNSTYEATIQLLENTNYEYLFVNGGTPTKEVLDPAWLCTNGNAQYTNRVINTPSVDVTTCSKWASCDPCSPTSINEITTTDLQLVYANQGLMISSTKVKSIDQLVIFDVMGKQVFATKSNVNTNALLPVQFDAAGIYLVKLTVNNQVMTFKVFAGN